MGAAGESEKGKVRKTGISFGNFVFLGLRSNSGSRYESNVGLYLHGGNGSQGLTDYRCSFVVQTVRYV